VEAKFRQVRDYIRDHPHENVDQVAVHTDTAKKQILEWVKEERLQFDKPELVGLTCRKCGMIIPTGMFCKECKKEITQALKGETTEDSAPVFSTNLRTQTKKDGRPKMRANYIRYE
jgi:hypothetical protein